MASSIAAYTALGRAGLPKDFDLRHGHHGLFPSRNDEMANRASLVRGIACLQRLSFAM
jgi:hypothetical protein